MVLTTLDGDTTVEDENVKEKDPPSKVTELELDNKQILDILISKLQSAPQITANPPNICKKGAACEKRVTSKRKISNFPAISTSGSSGRYG